MIRPTFIDDFLDTIAVALVLADDPRVERRLVRKASERLDHFGSQLGLAQANVLRRFQCCDLGSARVEVFLSFGQQIRRQHLPRRRLRRLRRQNIPICLSMCRRRYRG